MGSEQNAGKKKNHSSVSMLSDKIPARKKAGGISIRLVTVGKKKKKVTVESKGTHLKIERYR